MFPIDLKRFFVIKKLKTLCHGYMLSVILKSKKLLERFTKEVQTPNQQRFRFEKVRYEVQSKVEK